MTTIGSMNINGDWTFLASCSSKGLISMIHCCLPINFNGRLALRAQLGRHHLIAGGSAAVKVDASKRVEYPRLQVKIDGNDSEND